MNKNSLEVLVRKSAISKCYLIRAILVTVLMSLLCSCVVEDKVQADSGGHSRKVLTAVYGFDGTGKNLKHGHKTNVYHFLQAHRTSDPSVTNYYAGGVGSAHKNILDVPGKLTGEGGRAIIESMYGNLVRNFRKGHKGIVIVGFSRGAALSREFAHVIAERGDPMLYRKGELPRGKAPEILFMGLFDTVYAFGIGAGKHDLDYRKTIATNVRAVAHATAGKEKRNFFDLWSIHPNPKNLNSDIGVGSIEQGNFRIEKEYAAGHDDVGGARGNNKLGYKPLKWVIDQAIAAGVHLVIPNENDFSNNIEADERGAGARQIYHPPYKETKVSAIEKGKAANGCRGKQIYLSKGSCYSCPQGYVRFSVTRKMTHPKACRERGFSLNTTKASYKWESNGCAKGQFKHLGLCKVCPPGSSRKHALGLDTRFCHLD
jgi:hypothetical protein